ncbi:MAG: DUF1648 domain-containing protein [Halobellus sp.]|uniref:DUF1648 domain-containing protein n=1 Tax=Halobellus sp. TaxID=1979212 RepID=UPI0035D4DA69
MRYSRLDALSVALHVAGIAGVALLPSLPDRMAVRFGTGGAPNECMTAPLAVAFVPAIGLLTLGAVRGALPFGRDGPAPAIFGVALAAFLTSVHGVAIAWNLGIRLNVTLFVVPGGRRDPRTRVPLQSRVTCRNRLVRVTCRNWLVQVTTKGNS